MNPLELIVTGFDQQLTIKFILLRKQTCLHDQAEKQKYSNINNISIKKWKKSKQATTITKYKQKGDKEVNKKQQLQYGKNGN